MRHLALAPALLAALAACHDAAAVASAPPTPSAAPGPAAARAQAAYYTAELRAGSEPCVHGKACRATIRLAALGKYHVNEEYPFRFVPDAAPGVSFGAERPLVHEDAQHGTLDIELTPAAAGTLRLAGVFKLSVCSESACQIERPRLGIDLSVE